MLEWLNKKKVKNLVASALTFITLLGASGTASAVSRDTFDAFRNTEPTFNLAVKGDKEAFNSFRSQVDSAMKKLRIDIKRDIAEKNFDNALKGLDTIYKLLIIFNNVGEFRPEINEVATMQKEIRDAKYADSSGKTAEKSGDIAFEKFESYKDGVYHRGGSVFVISHVKPSANMDANKQMASYKAESDFVNFLLITGIAKKSSDPRISYNLNNFSRVYQSFDKSGNFFMVFEVKGYVQINGNDINIDDVIRATPELK